MARDFQLNFLRNLNPKTEVELRCDRSADIPVCGGHAPTLGWMIQSLWDWKLSLIRRQDMPIYGQRHHGHAGAISGAGSLGFIINGGVEGTVLQLMG